MLDFDELRELAKVELEEEIVVSKADLQPIASFAAMPEGVELTIFDNYYPETRLWRDGAFLVAEIAEHIYTKFWEHKWHGRVFAEAMVRAVKRFRAEGRAYSEGEIENDDDPHIFVRWQLRMPAAIPGPDAVEAIGAAFEDVWARADAILENAESVLILGKDTDAGLERLRRIAACLEDLGYYALIIKDQPDRLGETVIQKVMRYALSSKFVLVENTEPSGHLYEIPHVGKAAECVIGFLQESGKGATWMFEDAFARQQNWQKFQYDDPALEQAVDAAVRWAEGFIASFAGYQQRVLPWMRPGASSQAGGQGSPGPA